MWGAKERELSIKIAYVVEEDGERFHAFAPAFKGLHVDGNTKEDAVRNLVTGLQVYFASIETHRDPLPIGPYLMVDYETPKIPQGAFLGSLIFQWPSLQTSGIS